MKKLLIFLTVFIISSCVANEKLVESSPPKLQIISFDVVQKQLLVDANIPDNLQLLITRWFNDKIKLNGFDGSMVFKVTSFNQDITLINNGKRVDAFLSFKINLIRSSQTKKKFIEGSVSSYGELTGDFSLNDFDNVINNVHNDLILRLSKELKSISN